MSSKPARTKVERRRARRQKELARDAIVDVALGGVRLAMPGAGLCLPTCVLLQRILAQSLPGSAFSLRLGSLQVHPQDGTASVITFDPRTPEGIDGGFHAWLEDKAGKVLDPSIAVTLHDEGYEVDPNTYFLDAGRKFVRHGLLFIYEELPELELVGIEESEPHLAGLMALALDGEVPEPGLIHLDVRWRNSPTTPGSGGNE